MVNTDFAILSVKYAETLVERERLKESLNVYKDDRERFDEQVRLLHNYVNNAKSIPKTVKKRLNELIFNIR